jgi:8-oxo-dGTP pyrophosphatase MutT (NUDIX family)
VERCRTIAAVHLFLLRGGRVLLLRRRNTGYEDGNDGVPAGHLDGDETVVAAAAREAREEVGVAIAPGDLRAVGVMHRRGERADPGNERVDFFFEATRWEGEVVNREPGKCDDLLWADPRRLPANVIPYVRRALENRRRGVWFDEFGWD